MQCSWQPDHKKHNIRYFPITTKKTSYSRIITVIKKLPQYQQYKINTFWKNLEGCRYRWPTDTQCLLIYWIRSCGQQTNNIPTSWRSVNRLTLLATKNVKHYELQLTDRQRPGPLKWLFKNYDDTRIHKAAWHTKQILAELTEPGGWTKHYGNTEPINFIWAREERSQN